MILDLNGKIVSGVHKICITNHVKNKYICVSSKGIRWTDNFNLATCFDDAQDALEFTELPSVQAFIGDELELLVWTDTGKSIYDNN